MFQHPDAPDFLPISHLNACAYCPRRFYYEFVLGEMVVNEHVLEGQQLHERVDQPGKSTRGTREQLRRLSLCAPQLGVTGYCDLIEVELDGSTNDLVSLASGPNFHCLNVSSRKRSYYSCKPNSIST